MSTPVAVNTVDGTCWTRREGVRDGQALYAPEKCDRCPEFVMATYAELEEHGIAGEAYALPVPAGPQMPEFPPPPRTELEKLHAERARLQGLLAEAVQDAHRARSERDLMRERVSEPYGCTHCGIAKRVHGRRYLGGAGMHTWTAPSQEQIAERMKARRTVRLAEDAERQRARVDEVERVYAFDTAELRRGLDKAHDELTGANLSLYEEELLTQRLRLAWKSASVWRRELRRSSQLATSSRQRWRTACIAAERERDELKARVAELEAERHTTNEALSDAAETLRANRDRIAELEAQEQAEEKIRPHRQAVANSNLHYIGKLELRIRRARVLHLNHPDPERCAHDGQAWPCQTVAALEAAVGEAVYPCGCPKRFSQHADGCPTEAARSAEAADGDTLPAWLYRRFLPEGEDWDRLDSGQREYWEHQAKAVRRAVERGGFKAPSADGVTRRIAPTQALREGEDVTPQVQKLRALLAGQRAAVEDPHDSPLRHTYRLGHDLPETGGAR